MANTENQNLIARRRQLEMSQEAVAFQADITRPGYIFIEQGKRTPSVVTAIKIANALGITDYRSFKSLWLV